MPRSRKALAAVFCQHSLIQRDTSKFRFGVLGEFTGDIFMMDLASIHSGWEGMIKGSAGLQQADEALALSMFESMPAAVHAIFHRGNTKVWSMLVRENWIMPPQSITLSLGSHIAGDWRILGVVDALPTSKASTPPAAPTQSVLGKVFDQLGPKLREFMGRPDDCFGFTPVLVYRAITRKS